MHRLVKQTIPLAILVLVASIFAACGNTTGTGSAGSKDNVAALVNGKEIKLSEVDTILNQQIKGQQTQLSPLELAAARLQVLDELIKQEVLFQRAEKENLAPKEEDITQAINEQKQQNGMTQEQYEKMLKETNQTEQMVRDIARKQIAVKRLLDKLGSQVGTPSDREVEDFYNNNRERYVASRGVGLAAIVVDPADNKAQDDAKGEAEAKQKADIIYQRLKNGADFATVARERSEDQSAVRGGDIGFHSEDELKQIGLPQDLIGKFFGQMQNGDITPPVSMNNGQWYIFKLTDKRLQTENLTLQSPEVRKDITDGLLNQRRQILNAALLEVAMNESRVENKLAADMLASPDKMSGLRPATSPAAGASPAANASPAAGASPAASPAASATPQPSGSPAAPAASPSPKK
ncbi:MAG TPA: SurA N-terminal domain-containing protein [Pyrinomonadaceae bacterium]